MMKEKNEVSIALIILNCICAVIWIVILIFDLMNEYVNSVQLILHIVLFAGL